MPIRKESIVKTGWKLNTEIFDGEDSFRIFNFKDQRSGTWWEMEFPVKWYNGPEDKIIIYECDKVGSSSCFSGQILSIGQLRRIMKEKNIK